MIDNLGLYDLRLAEKLNSIIVCVFIDGVKNNIAIVCHIIGITWSLNLQFVFL